MSEDTPADSVRASREEVWNLKAVSFGTGESRRNLKIITQNFNGPCSFIAICNILILRNDIQILPEERTTVSYEFLSQLVGGYLLANCPGVDLAAALSIMPLTQKGLDLNPLFTSVSSFRPAGDGGALKLFEHAGIKLVHGWLVDPESPEYHTLAQIQDYDSGLNLIVEADNLAQGELVTSSDTEAGPSSPIVRGWTDEERSKVESAIEVRRFLDNTQSQLTYCGLFALASLVEPGGLVAIFRNSHLAVLHKSEGETQALYTLVTDDVFLNESSVVWERLEDVDGNSTLVDSDFVRSSPVGGDFAGQTAEGALAALEAELGNFAVVDPADQALARQLQAEEDAHAHRLYAQQKRERAEQESANRRRANGPGRRSEPDADGQNKKKPTCIIM